MPTTGGEKYADIHQVLEAYLTPEASESAIVYCAKSRRSEEVAENTRNFRRWRPSI